MDKRLNFLYDHAADVLHISVGHPIFSDSVPLNDEIILQVDPTTQEIVGFSIIDFIKRFANHEEPTVVPLNATLEPVTKARKKRVGVESKAVYRARRRLGKARRTAVKV